MQAKVNGQDTWFYMILLVSIIEILWTSHGVVQEWNIDQLFEDMDSNEYSLLMSKQNQTKKWQDWVKKLSKGLARRN